MPLYCSGPELVFPVVVGSVVQRAEIEWGGIIARHARGRCALNLGKRVNLCKFEQLRYTIRTILFSVKQRFVRFRAGRLKDDPE